MENIQYSLYNKSWLIHIVMTFSRVVYPVLGIAHWQKAYNSRREYDNLNHEFIDKSEAVIKTIIIALIPVGVILDLLIWRYRHLANWVIYYEFVQILLQGFVPFQYGDFQLLML